MKKIFTLCLALFCATATFAQNDNNFNSKGTFVFTDKDGNVYEDGDVITRDEAEESPFGGIQIASGLYVKQTVADFDGAPLLCGMSADIKKIDNGELQFCFPGSCRTADKVGFYDATIIQKIKSGASLVTEWTPGWDEDEENQLEGMATATFTLYAFQNFGSPEKPNYYNYGAASSITVNFVHGTTGINGVVDNSKATVNAIYTVDGTRVQKMQKGLNIVKLSNGKTMKIVNK